MIIVLSHVHQVLGTEHARLPETHLVQAAVCLEHLWTKQLDPLTVFGFSDLAWVTAVSGEHRISWCEVEVNRPLVPLQMKRQTPTRHQEETSNEEIFAFGILPVVPDGLA